MNKAQVFAVAIGGAGVLASVVTMLGAWLHFVRKKGLKTALPWALVLPAPWTKAMYLFMLILVSNNTDKAVGAAWLMVAAAVFAFVALVQAAFFARRMRIECKRNVDEDVKPPYSFFHVASEVNVRFALHIMMAGVVETMAVLTFVLVLILGRYGTQFPNAAARSAGRVVGGLATSFVGGAVEGGRDAAKAFDDKQPTQE